MMKQRVHISENPINTNQKVGVLEGMAVNMMRRTICGSTLVWRLTGLPFPKGKNNMGTKMQKGSLC
jgi:hypothetical protein